MRSALAAAPQIRVRLNSSCGSASRPDRLGASLALAEALQRQGRLAEATGLVARELRRSPGQPLLLASLEDLREGDRST